MNADWLEAIRTRYGQLPPEPWLQCWTAGLFDPQHDHHVQLSDLIWASPEAIATHVFPKDQVSGLIPFAHTAADDWWCWYIDWTHEEGLPVVFCPHEDEVAFAYAPHFEGFLYRAALEEYACTCLTERHSPGTSLAILGDYAARLVPFLRRDWSETLSEVAARPLIELEHGYWGTCTEADADEIWQPDFAQWADCDREFEHFVGN
jgi:hypothetical protein